MNILFFQWRYHTNRHPMVKGLQEGGHKVKYISQYSRPEAENYNAITPTVIGFSRIFEYFAKKFNKFDSGTRMKYGWSPLRSLWKEMRSFQPDIVIVRNYGYFQAIVLTLGNLMGADGIIQEQHPKFKHKLDKRKTVIDRIYKSIYRKPVVRVTPIKGDEKNGVTTPNCYYVPFPIDGDIYEPFKKDSFFAEGNIRIISVGKFSSQRKNHLDLLEACNRLSKYYNLRLTLVGHLDDDDNNYYQRILQYISKHDLKDLVTIKINLPHAELQRMYSDYDLFVLPSKNEPAAISPLEAMAAGLPVICSDTNGTREYIEEGNTGYVFQTGSVNNLESAIESIVSDQRKIKYMSRNSLKYVKSTHHHTVYCKNMEKMIKNNFN